MADLACPTPGRRCARLGRPLGIAREVGGGSDGIAGPLDAAEVPRVVVDDGDHEARSIAPLSQGWAPRRPRDVRLSHVMLRSSCFMLAQKPLVGPLRRLVGRMRARAARKSCRPPRGRFSDQLAGRRRPRPHRGERAEGGQFSLGRRAILFLGTNAITFRTIASR